MEIVIIGWYGTETLGDRAIIDGIFRVFRQVCPDSVFHVGSLYPFYTNRTMFEEKETFKDSLGGSRVKVFNIRKYTDVKDIIKKSGLLIIGGGPLMDNIEELHIIESCFMIAKKNSIRTIVFGCGIGPLRYPDHRGCVKRILNMSDLILLRDVVSCQIANDLLDKDGAKYIGDPAIISIESYRNKNVTKDKSIMINLRDYPRQAYSAMSNITDTDLVELIRQCALRYEDVILTPMHTFCIGGDDRSYLTKLAQYIKAPAIRVIHKPLNLSRLYEMISKVEACIGMRYHAVVMHTILNGNNHILDYTDPENGKIKGFIRSLDASDFYNERITYLQRFDRWDIDAIIMQLLMKKKYNYKKSDILDLYINELNDYLKNR